MSRNAKIIITFQILFGLIVFLIGRKAIAAYTYEIAEIKPIRLDLKNLRTIRLEDIGHIKIIKDLCEK